MDATRDTFIGLAYGLIVITLTICLLAFVANRFHGANEEEVFLKWHERAKAGHGGVISPTLVHPGHARDATPQLPGNIPPAIDKRGGRP